MLHCIFNMPPPWTSAVSRMIMASDLNINQHQQMPFCGRLSLWCGPCLLLNTVVNYLSSLCRIVAAHGMMSLCYGNLVVCNISVTPCRLCREACHWPDTLRFCDTPQPGVIRTKIVLNEINSSNQRTGHTLYLDTGDTKTHMPKLHFWFNPKEKAYL